MRLLAALALLAVLGTVQALGPVATPADEAAAGLSGVFQGLPLQAPGPSGTPGGAVSCGGTAPVSTSCSVGFAGAPGEAYAMTVNGGAGFTGTILAVLSDSTGHHRGLSCTYVAFLGGVSPAPDCSRVASDDLDAGEIQLTTTVTAPSGLPVALPVSVGYWEVDVN
jgi:hypothetical protein